MSDFVRIKINLPAKNYLVHKKFVSRVEPLLFVLHLHKINTDLIESTSKILALRCLYKVPKEGRYRSLYLYLYKNKIEVAMQGHVYVLESANETLIMIFDYLELDSSILKTACPQSQS